MKTTKVLLSVLLVAILMISSLPMTFSAAETDLSDVGSNDAVTVNVTSFLNENDGVSIGIFNSENKIVRFRTVYGNDVVVVFNPLDTGSYVLSVSKRDHADHRMNLFITGGAANITKDVELHPLGDINGDGVVNNFDYGRINSHARGKSELTGYEFSCGDINKDGVVNNFDAGRANSHARGKSLIW